MRHGLNIFIVVSIGTLLLTIFEDFGSVNFQDVDLLSQIGNRVLNYINSIDILLLIINVDLNKKCVLFLLVRESDGLITSRLVLTTYINSCSDIKNT